MKTPLFSEFQPLSSKQWKQQIQFELDGKDYNETLVWDSLEKIKIKPFYHSDDIQTQFDPKTEASKFKIGETIFVKNIEKSNQNALNSIMAGATSIWFIIDDEHINIEILVAKINLKKVQIYFKTSFLSTAFVEKIEALAKKNDCIFYCIIDPIGHLAKDGNWYKTPDNNNFEPLKQFSKNLKNTATISIDSSLYQNAGASIIQQLAYSLAHANEYFDQIETYQQNFVFQVAIGGNYFFEIAKLRALRLLFATLAGAYQHDLDCHIVAIPSKRNKSIFDANSNILRTTTESMAAILGGANVIFNLPHDALHQKNNTFSSRIARNQLLILKEESYFDKVNNPADGSYYIDYLTNQFATQALDLFKEIEKNGGFLAQLKTGKIQAKISENAAKEQLLFDEGKEVLVGTNKYLDNEESLENELELFPFIKIKARKTLVVPIIEKRWAEKNEQKRLKIK
jgi:methylmalonyl-CoA mutase